MPRRRPRKLCWKQAKETKPPAAESDIQPITTKCARPTFTRKSTNSGITQDNLEKALVNAKPRERSDTIDTPVSTNAGQSDGEEDQETETLTPKSRCDADWYLLDAALAVENVAGNIPAGLNIPISAAFNDVASDDHGQLALIPNMGSLAARTRVEDFSPDAVVAIRVFRFFEKCSEGGYAWEKELCNVNSGSILWLPVHLTPGMHSKLGAKYGKWFTVHYVQVRAKHFKSAYHMCIEGCSPARSFGSTGPSATTKMITGKDVEQGYFWFVSPTSCDSGSSGQDHLDMWGWRHLAREGPFDGAWFLEEWEKQGSPLEARGVQAVLDRLRKQTQKSQA